MTYAIFSKWYQDHKQCFFKLIIQKITFRLLYKIQIVFYNNKRSIS